MQTRRQAAASNMSLVLPRRPTLLSPATSPHTPSSRIQALPIFSPASNKRKSSDSWNSSNHDDEMDWEWKQEEILLLQRTLDALPSHLLTPFNGPVPPSNLLDKIARGVSHAKGPAEWPHSLRATRAKIVELARVRAKETVHVEIVEEECDDAPRDVLRPTSRTNRKRPLYRQSSMDFIHEVDTSVQNNQSISHLSQRLQRTDRVLPTSGYHPYSRPTSPTTRRNRPAYSPVLNPSTPSSTTLNTLSSISPTSPDARRSFSSISSSSSEAYSSYPLNPRVQRMKRADSFAAPAARNNALKRAPSFSAASVLTMDSNTMSVDGSVFRDKEVGSSDEEEKQRSKKAKKARKRSPPMSPSPLPPAEKPATKKLTKAPKVNTPVAPPTPVSTKRTSRPRANLERNPSILGGELPRLQPPMSPVGNRISVSSEESARNSAEIPATHKTLRRVKATSFATRPMARRISFSSLAQEENCEPLGAGLGLGSAFQLR